MSRSLSLTISTPMDLLVNEPSVNSVRAEDESGEFGILPGHTDFLTALPASVLRWRAPDGRQHFCALRAGLLTVTGGARVSIACREGILGDDLAALADEVTRYRTEEADADRRLRVEQMRLHSMAVRQLMRFLRPEQSTAFEAPPSIGRA